MEFTISENDTFSMHSSWIHIRSNEDYLEAVDSSNETDVVVFKHSTRCGISASALHELLEKWDLAESRLKLYYLDLITYRSVSNYIEEHTSVRHQSPQIILFRSGEPIFNTSHFRIGMPTILDQLA